MINELQQGFGKARVGFRQQVDKTGLRFRVRKGNAFPCSPWQGRFCAFHRCTDVIKRIPIPENPFWTGMAGRNLLCSLFLYVVVVNEAGNFLVALPGEMKGLPIEHHERNHHFMVIQKAPDGI